MSPENVIFSRAEQFFPNNLLIFLLYEIQLKDLVLREFFFLLSSLIFCYKAKYILLYFPLFFSIARRRGVNFQNYEG